MTYYFPNVDPIYLFKRAGTDEDPFLFLIDKRRVMRNYCILQEIPSHKHGVTIKDAKGNVLTEVTHSNPSTGEYRVDYSQGIVFFGDDMDGQEITAEYYGMGRVNIPATRVLTIDGNDDPVESLQDALNRVQDGINTLEQVGDLDFKGEYSPDVEYKKWNFVTFNNKTYVAIQNNINVEPTNTNYWRLVSSGVGFAGIYDESKVYGIGDIVTDSAKKNMYISKVDNNTSPLSSSDHWELMLTLDDAVDNLVTIIDQKINELQNLRNQLLDDENQRKQNEIIRDEKIDNFNQLFNEFKQDIIESEAERILNEGTRQDNESQRINQENIRKLNEQSRIEAEQIRQQQENDRQVAFSNALNDVDNAIGRTNDVIDQVNNLMTDINDIKDQAEAIVRQAQDATLDLQEFKHMGEYNPSTTYYKYNIVSFDGSTYMAIRETQGDSLDDTFYWQLLSERGRDGSMITVDGIEPDENGNIDLTEANYIKADDVDNMINQTKNEFNIKTGDLALLKTMRKDSLVAAINELKSRIDDIIDILSPQ